MRLRAIIGLLLVTLALASTTVGQVSFAETPQKRDVDLSQPTTGKTGWHSLVPLSEIQETSAEPDVLETPIQVEEPAPQKPAKTPKKKAKKKKQVKQAKKARSKRQKKLTPPPSRWAFGYSDTPIPGASYDIIANGKVITPTVQLDDWIDGTKVSASKFDGGFYMMVWEHPDHVRVVVGFGGHLLRRGDKNRPYEAGATTVTVRANGQELHTYTLANMRQGQEFSHHIGHRKWTRTPQDIIDMGLWPRMTPYEGYQFNVRTKTFMDEPRPSPEVPFKPIPFDWSDGYQPLHSGPVRPAMPKPGDHPPVHSTRGFAHLALWPDGTTNDAARRNIFVSAESAAGYPWHLHHRGKYTPLDVHRPYYNESNFKNNGSNLEAQFVRVGGHNETRRKDGGKYHDLVWDTAHLANAAWEMYLINGDPYYLRGWQMSIITPILAESPGMRAQGFRYNKPYPVIARSQPRGYGKHLMLMLRLVEVMPEGEWNWLQPKSFFEKILQNTAVQSQWTAKQVGALNGDFPRSWTGGKKVLKYGAEHSHMQAFWSLGWALHLGYTKFQDLFDVHKAAVLKQWRAFGVGQAVAYKDMQSKDPQTGKRRPFSDLDAAIDYAASLRDYQGPETAFTTFVWRQERFTGIYAALSQYHGEPFTSIAKTWVRERQSHERDFLGRKYQRRIQNIEAYDFDLKREVGKLYSRKPDWMFAIGPEKKS
ncbi:MAG: hypothetical protein AAF221_09865 [Pseudomonadota bacterium]